MVKDQNGGFVVNLVVKSMVYHFDHWKFAFLAMVMVKMGSFLVEFCCKIVG